MTRKLIKNIKWSEVYSGATYLYGSLLNITEEYMDFNNLRLSSGKPIVKFVSRTHYQGDRRTPDLPLLIPNETYTIESHILSNPENRFFIQIDFYNRQNEKIKFSILRENIATFTCPTDTFHYAISVFSAGSTKFTFQDIKIYQENVREPIRLHTSLKQPNMSTENKMWI